MPEFQLSHYPQVGIILQLARFTAENYRAGVSDAALTLEVSTKFRGSFHNIFLKAPTKAFSLLKGPTSEFTRHYHYHKWIMHVSTHTVSPCDYACRLFQHKYCENYHEISLPPIANTAPGYSPNNNLLLQMMMMAPRITVLLPSSSLLSTFYQCG